MTVKEDQAEYDRIMAGLAEQFFENRCAVTYLPYKPHDKIRFQIHHVQPLDEGEVFRKHYPYTVKGKLEYITALAPLIMQDPDRYALVIEIVHRRLDDFATGITRGRFNDKHLDARSRLCDLAMRTRHG